MSENKWVAVSDELPKLGDYSVLAFFVGTGSIETVHVDDHFKNITNGPDDNGNQTYTKWYLHSGISHWMHLPESPEV